VLEKEGLVRLGPERLAKLVIDEAKANPAFKKLVEAALAATKGPSAVAAIVDKRLARLEKATAAVSWGKAKDLGGDLSATLKIITGDLAAADPSSATERLMRFLATADRTRQRTNDAGIEVAPVYRAAAEALPPLVERLAAEERASLADRFYELTAGSRCGMVVPVIPAVLALLPPPAVDQYDARLAEAVRQLGPIDEGKPDWSLRARIRRLIELRQLIADVRRDVDAFIALETALPGDLADVTEIAVRLVEAGRASEALEWIRGPAKPAIKGARTLGLQAGLPARDVRADRRHRVEIRALEALRERKEAQSLRWAIFEETFDADMLREYIAKLPDFEDVEALDAAFAFALSSPQIYAALHFLTEWPRQDLAERLVIERRGEWDGAHYEILAPAAEALESKHPLAAVILYRALIDSILNRGQSPAYGHAARYYAALQALEPREDPGWPIDRARTYRVDLRSRHPRKYGFWSLIETEGRAR
jgi:hypothetical protein